MFVFQPIYHIPMWNLNIWMTTIKEAIQIVNGLAYQLIFTLMWKSDQNLYVLNGLHVNEILTFKNFNLVDPKKIFMYHPIMDVIIIMYQNFLLIKFPCLILGHKPKAKVATLIDIFIFHLSICFWDMASLINIWMHICILNLISIHGGVPCFQ